MSSRANTYMYVVSISKHSLLWYVTTHPGSYTLPHKLSLYKPSKPNTTTLLSCSRRVHGSPNIRFDTDQKTYSQAVWGKQSFWNHTMLQIMWWLWTDHRVPVKHTIHSRSKTFETTPMRVLIGQVAIWVVSYQVCYFQMGLTWCCNKSVEQQSVCFRPC